MLVRDVMTTHVHTVPEESTFKEMVSLLTKHKISGVPVVNENKKVIGIISEKDLLNALFPSQKQFYQDIKYFSNFENEESEIRGKAAKLKAKDLMTRNVVSIKPDDHILRACSLFLTHNIRRLIVVKDDKLVGIVTTNNIYRNFLNTIIQ